MAPPRRRPTGRLYSGAALSRRPLRAPNPIFKLPDGIRAFPDGFFRSRTAIQRTRAPGLLSGRPSKKPGGSGTFPDARDTFPGRHPGNPGIREAILAVGKAIQPFGFVPEGRARYFSVGDRCFRAGTDIKSPGQENQGFGRPKLEPG